MCQFHDLIEVLRPVVSLDEDDFSFGRDLYNELCQLPGVSLLPQDIEPIIDLSMLESPSNTDLDSPLIDSSNSCSSSQSQSDDQSQDIDADSYFSTNLVGERHLLPREMFLPHLNALREERVVVFSKRTGLKNGQMQLFSIVRDDHFCYFGWFADINSITGIGYLFSGDGSYYRGEFSAGEKNGYGELYYDNGSHYDGYWKQNSKQGNGRFYFNKDLHYIGKWENNKMIECELQYSSRISNPTHVYHFMTSNNDYIFFKQSQLSTHPFFLIIERHQQSEYERAASRSRFPRGRALLKPVFQRDRGDEHQCGVRAAGGHGNCAREFPRCIPAVPKPSLCVAFE